MLIISKPYRFLKYTKYKKLALKALIYSGYYRIRLLYTRTNKQYRHWGIEGKESPYVESDDAYNYAMKVSQSVIRICNRTKWESKCLVRALTAQKLLKNKKISSTLYLGCGLDENGKMVAHAWLRCGGFYVTGGSGEEYSIVDKFCIVFNNNEDSRLVLINRESDVS